MKAPLMVQQMACLTVLPKVQEGIADGDLDGVLDGTAERVLDGAEVGSTEGLDENASESHDRQKNGLSLLVGSA